MTGKEFLNSIAKGKSDFLAQFLAILNETSSLYCVIGGLAVNAYVEPEVSLDVDIVLAVHDIDRVVEAARAHDLKVDQLEQRNPSSRRRPRTADNPASAAARLGSVVIPSLPGRALVTSSSILDKYALKCQGTRRDPNILSC